MDDHGQVTPDIETERELATEYLHLTPRQVWDRQSALDTYTPEAYDADGFIHLTIGEANLVDVGNRYYRSDPRPYVVLRVDPSRISAPVRFEDDAGSFPHVYGPLNRDAVTAVDMMRRSETGEFLSIVGTDLPK